MDVKLREQVLSLLKGDVRYGAFEKKARHLIRGYIDGPVKDFLEDKADDRYITLRGTLAYCGYKLTDEEVQLLGYLKCLRGSLSDGGDAGVRHEDLGVWLGLYWVLEARGVVDSEAGVPLSCKVSKADRGKVIKGLGLFLEGKSTDVEEQVAVKMLDGRDTGVLKGVLKDCVVAYPLLLGCLRGGLAGLASRFEEVCGADRGEELYRSICAFYLRDVLSGWTFNTQGTHWGTQLVEGLAKRRSVSQKVRAYGVKGESEKREIDLACVCSEIVQYGLCVQDGSEKADWWLSKFKQAAGGSNGR